MRYANIISVFLLLGMATPAYAQMTIRKPDTTYNVRSITSKDNIRENMDTGFASVNKKIEDLQKQLADTLKTLNDVNTRLATAESALQQSAACAAQGLMFNGNMCVDTSALLMSSMPVESSNAAFVPAQEYSEEASDTVAPNSATPPTTEDIIPQEEPKVIGGSQPAEADTGEGK